MPIPALGGEGRAAAGEIPGGGRMTITLDDVSPEAIKTMDEFFDILKNTVSLGTETDISLEIKEIDEGIPLELQRFFSTEGLKLRVDLPLDENTGAKLGLIFKLQMRAKDMDRVELLARRISTFTREEAAYWLSRVTTFRPDENRWAQAGLKIMLGGVPGDKAIDTMLKN